jgi:hypothetical protein
MPAIGFDEALRTILSTVQPLPAENVGLAQALGRVAAAFKPRRTSLSPRMALSYSHALKPQSRFREVCSVGYAVRVRLVKALSRLYGQIAVRPCGHPFR